MRGINGFIFTFDGKPYTNHEILSDVWKKSLKKASLTHIKLYAGTRHSFASQCVNNEVEFFQLQAFLGHTNPATTKRYAHLNTTGLKMVLDKRRGKLIKMEKRQTSPRVALMKNEIL